MIGLKYSLTKGFRDGDLLLYSHFEKKLFYKTNDRLNGQQDYACYENIMNKGCNCKARLHLRADNSCERNKQLHIDHENHEITFRDMESLDAMREKCRYLIKHYPASAQKIPVKEIFLSEMIK